MSSASFHAPLFSPILSKMEQFTLCTGDGTRNYCAFPTLLELEDGTVLCAWKQGFSHMADEGITNYIRMDKSGVVKQSGTAASVPGFNTQNAELIRLRDGTVQCWLDVQDYKNRKIRTGAVRYTYKDGTFIAEEGILTDTDGIQYGYVFDGVTWKGRDYILAMTFPELASSVPQKNVRLLVTEDCGKTWKSIANLDEQLSASVNESALVPLDNKLYIFCRGYDSLGYMAVLDADGKLLAQRKYEVSEGIYKTGRPKLFVRGGKLFAIMRNHRDELSAMRLDLIRFDDADLSVQKITTLDDQGPKAGDGYYAEHYFDGETLCVVTYKPTVPGSQPDIVLLRTNWNGGHLSERTQTVVLNGAKKRDPSSDQGSVRITLPDGWDGKSMVLVLHGSGRGIEDYDTVPFYQKQKELALQYGYGFAILQNGQDTYGTDIGYHNTVLAAEELITHWTQGEKLILWATSAGGVNMYRYAAEHAENVRFLIGTFAVLDLQVVFPLLASCRNAWNAGDKTAEAFAEMVKGKNPAKMLEKLRDIPIYLSHGAEDTAVPIAENARILFEKLGAYLHEIPDAGHGTSDFRYYDEAPHRALRKEEGFSRMLYREM